MIFQRLIDALIKDEMLELNAKQSSRLKSALKQWWIRPYANNEWSVLDYEPDLEFAQPIRVVEYSEYLKLKEALNKLSSAVEQQRSLWAEHAVGHCVSGYVLDANDGAKQLLKDIP